MLDERHNQSCPREEQIISYLYREMPPGEIDRFESHLAECGSCVDELAAVSVPRLAVYEWRTNVFDKIPAPSVELPLVRERQPRTEGLLGRLSDMLTGWPTELRIGAGFAALLIVGFSAFLLIRTSSSPDVARNMDVQQPQQIHQPVIEITEPPAVDLPADADTGSGSSVPGESAEPVRKTVRERERTKMPAKAEARHVGRSEFAANRKEQTTAERPLRLNNFEDEDDTTLRLAELFEEVGSL